MQNDWYSNRRSWRVIIMTPLSWLFSYFANARKNILKKIAYRSKLPVIVVGNISVGGTGKTPAVQSIATFMQRKGYCPAIITRGFGGRSSSYPFKINQDTSPYECGDEPFMLNSLLDNIPIVVSPKRIDSIKFIETNLKSINIIISDDGLQHYYMHRDIEISVVDGEREFGNGLCLPAGPLREPVTRLEDVDMVIVNATGNVFSTSKTPKFSFVPYYRMELIPDVLVHVKTRQKYTIKQIINSFGVLCYGVAGIGNPNRFFCMLERTGFYVEKYPFQDHHIFSPKDFNSMKGKNKLVVMTHKDAVKCQHFAQDNWYYISVLPKIEEDFFQLLYKKTCLCVKD